MIVPVILCGGSGTRLWPVSRESYPKQFLPLAGEKSLLQATVGRLKGLDGVLPPLLMANDQHRFLVAEQIRALGSGQLGILLEPLARSTAPAVACAALHLLPRYPEALLLVMPADHTMADIAGFQRAVRRGVPLARSGAMVTFGILPDRPEIGYGYIRRGSPLAGEEANPDGDDTSDGMPVFAVDRFVEKPDLDNARRFLAAGDHYWNSGMFLFRADRYLEELERFVPAIPAACRLALAGGGEDPDFLRLERDAFAASPTDSIDYAVMERTERGVVIPIDVGWNDVGSWSSLWTKGGRDADDNVIVGDVVEKDVAGCYLRSEGKLLTAVGIRDQAVVVTPDAVFVSTMDRVQEVKDIVARLKAAGRREAVIHRTAFRPWGSFETLNAAHRFQVKRITVRPGASL
ncbi:MAG: mannose-1-phosphate guanylyltransferase/mannose-6-phosphate isomerase, partial [Magnetococcales bacterium]|nr:mannose-1-phosphate guanylyltransferase/mannose-6-phosphate isomerase [Magnetococcales bacterium]